MIFLKSFWKTIERNKYRHVYREVNGQNQDSKTALPPLRPRMDADKGGNSHLSQVQVRILGHSKRRYMMISSSIFFTFAGKRALPAEDRVEHKHAPSSGSGREGIFILFSPHHRDEVVRK